MSTFGFIGPTYAAGSLNAEQCVNLYPEFDESGTGKSKAMLVSTPGYQTFATLPKSPVRGIWAGDNVMYAVGGDSLYKVTLGGVVTLRGVLNSATTPARMFSNGLDQLVVCSGGEIFCDSGAGPVSVRTDGYTSLTFLDGYFVALRNPTVTNLETSDKIYVSALIDGTTWDPLDFGRRQGNYDRVVQIFAHNQQLWIFGQETMEVWYNAGSADFPYDRIDGSAVDIGAWPWTIAELDQSLFFVGSNARGANVVYRTNGFIPERVSNHGVESALRDFIPSETPVAYTYQEAGHSFYVLRLSTRTWVYDTRTKQWHERGIWNSGTNTFDTHDAVCQAHLYFSSSNYIGSGTSGKIYAQNLSFGRYDGALIRRRRTAPYITNEQKRVFFHRLQLDLRTGTQATGTPTATLSWSDDNAHTFGNARTITLGAIGDYSKRAIFNRLGSGRNRVFRLDLPDLDGEVQMTDAFLDASPGNS